MSCEAFYTEAEAVDGNCPEHGTPLEWIEERNWFFRLSAYQERLLELYAERPEFVLPGFRANEARSFIERGLQDISVSRAGQPWRPRSMKLRASFAPKAGPHELPAARVKLE